jgi:hypothetical protein
VVACVCSLVGGNVLVARLCFCGLRPKQMQPAPRHRMPTHAIDETRIHVQHQGTHNNIDE